MALSPQAELTLLETAYAAALANGGITRYTIGGRSAERDIKWIADRMDIVRAAISRQTSGMFFVSQSRPKE